MCGLMECSLIGTAVISNNLLPFSANITLDDFKIPFCGAYVCKSISNSGGASM